MINHLVKFLLIGALSTFIHYFILLILVRIFDVDILISSGVGFIISSFFNYLLNKNYTFRSLCGHVESMPKFIFIATFGLLINTVMVWLVAVVMQWHYIIAQILATGCSVVWNFFLNRFWTFKNK